MKLNCDLAESFGSWKIEGEEQVMPLIDQANIACGFHAGDPVTMSKTLALAKQHQVSVGAHPGYPDLNGFGRRSMAMSELELKTCVQYQIAAVAGMASIQGLTLSYVKPHGALYNDMMRDDKVRATIMQAVADYPLALPLMLQATEQHQQHQAEADQYDLPLLFEAFADRGYTNQGLLVPRNQAGAMLNGEQMLERVKSLCEQGVIYSVDGAALTYPVDSLCVHGDNAESVAHIQEIQSLMRCYEN
ncbi:5-oxoprolinase subunit PxpA [Reinekea thalattae]|uniref:5-oxoprolinase subunit PxpA n=1 Tax=Reinekea thalattae TaxID=2593301 RepID=A0A5C8Z2I3_9GAMM|nr:5-oxoprolinase subunit PxpA [Reinekea thalattae]TXR51423.1 5-oxoprolinase subunit PxpA [Reinekea thalattae]